MSGKTQWHVAELIMSDRFLCELYKCSLGYKREGVSRLKEMQKERRERAEEAVIHSPVYKMTSLPLRATVCFQNWPHV